jgi:3',5'-cyclic AMP phosphodiesterase CpdA
MDPITILHISDPQFGKNHAFGGHGHLPSDRLADELGARILEDLQNLRRTPGLQPDIILLTGDISEWGLPSEFKVATDINRAASESYFLDCKAQELTPQMPYWPKLS